MCVFPSQGMPGLPGEKGESGETGLMVRVIHFPSGFTFDPGLDFITRITYESFPFHFL